MKETDGLDIIYENESVISYIGRKIEYASVNIINTDILESRIYEKLKKYYKFKKNPSFSRIKRIIDNEVADAFNRQSLERATVFSQLAVSDDFGESLEFEPKDVLANVEEKVLEVSFVDEKIARLATDDLEAYTLNAWANGLTDSEISRTLASRFGGKFDKYRKSIQRFRAKCQRKLAA